MKLVWSASVALGENSSSFSQITLKQTNDGLGSGKSLDMWTWIMPNVTFIIGHLESCLIWAESGQFWACNPPFAQKAETVLGQ